MRNIKTIMLVTVMRFTADEIYDACKQLAKDLGGKAEFGNYYCTVSVNSKTISLIRYGKGKIGISIEVPKKLDIKVNTGDDSINVSCSTYYIHYPHEEAKTACLVGTKQVSFTISEDEIITTIRAGKVVYDSTIEV